jgi:endoglucanase
MKRLAGLFFGLLFLLPGCLLPPKSATSAEAKAAADPYRHNLLENATFDDGSSLPWTSSFTAPGSGEASVQEGSYCLLVTDKGKNNWDAQVRHRDMVIRRGHSYSIYFVAWASSPTRVRPKVGMAGPPYAEYWQQTIELGTEPKAFTGSFTMNEPDDPTAEFTFHMGGPLADAQPPFTVCIDNVILADPEFTRARRAEALPVANVLVNQLGYLPHRVKIATARIEDEKPVAWRLLDGDGKEQASGMTLALGEDPASGEKVHLVDFSSFTRPGSGYRVQVADHLSHPFAIDPRLYRRLKYDALAYLYHNRSGIPIEMPYAGEPQWTRPAGHPGDREVSCAPGSGCDYSLDVSGGWYDAGDHGKYVVNGGIALWTLFNQYERSQYLSGSGKDFADGTMNIPENKNGAPDLLDEARYQMRFMLAMQVPEGEPLAGMAHHKMHNRTWTELGTLPHEDKVPRYLQPPSTAATLNLAATSAQCARIFKQIDPAFAEKCLAAAERAWAAARKNPARFAPRGGEGGGPYNDEHVQDEFYWAAAELFLGTDKQEYRDFVLKEPPEGKAVLRVLGSEADDAGQNTAMTWQNTQALGTISLATVPGALPEEERQAARQSVIAAADHFVKVIESQGYRLPFKPGPNNSYPWGSNSFVLNNMLVMALAHDFTGEKKYLDGVVLGMDYILGRNPMDQCYVTGYGARPLTNPHHRFWSHSLRNDRPPPPPGAVSGGPNSGLQDPHVKAAGLQGCAPQKCFRDHIEAWSTNEIAINWNAPLAWVAAFLDEKAQKTAE